MRRVKRPRKVEGEYYGTPKEIWGFVSQRGPVSPRRTARDFLEAHAPLFRFEKKLRGLAWQRTIESRGGHHVIFQQKHLGRRVHRAYVTVHMDRKRRVYLAKNRSMPASMLPAKDEFKKTEPEAVRRARKAVGRRATLQTLEPMWFPKDEGLAPAYRVRLSCTRPQEEWIIYVNAKTGGVLSTYDNLAKARGRALVFQPSPVTALGAHEKLLTAAGNPRRPPADAYASVTLFGLRSTGYLDGTRVTTRPSRNRIRRTKRAFLLESTARGFEEVMAYHHLDAALRYVRRIGYTGRRAIFREPVRANVRGTREDNSWYSPWDRLLTFGTGAIDDAEDGETILHEFGHALQDAICPDFGQSEEAAAMGEGFGDYFAASFFAADKPERYRPCVATWDGLLIGLDEGLDPPCLRRLDWDWTYDDFEKGGDEHDNGEIWAATLWDIWVALGRDVADAIIIESHFQLDGFTTFARGARAILDADRNLNGGAHRTALRRIFRDRRIGPI